MHRVWVKTKLRGNDEDDQVGIFNIIQKNPNTGVHLKVDEAVEGCTWKWERAGRQKTSLDHLSGLLHLQCSNVTTDRRVISVIYGSQKDVNTTMTKWALSFLYNSSSLPSPKVEHVARWTVDPPPKSPEFQRLKGMKHFFTWCTVWTFKWKKRAGWKVIFSGIYGHKEG